MRIITCPDELKLSDLCSKKVKVFLAGGIFEGGSSLRNRLCKRGAAIT